MRRRSEYDLEKARNRAHILEGLLIALDNLDEVITTIRESADVDDARASLMANFGLSELQANAILDMQLRRLAALGGQNVAADLKLSRDEARRLANLTAEIGSERGTYGIGPDESRIWRFG